MRITTPSLALLLFVAGCASPPKPTATAAPAAPEPAPRPVSPPFYVTDGGNGYCTRAVTRLTDGWRFTEEVWGKEIKVGVDAKFEHLDDTAYEYRVNHRKWTRDIGDYHVVVYDQKQAEEDKKRVEEYERDLKQRVYDKDWNRWYQNFRDNGYTDDEAALKASRIMRKD